MIWISINGSMQSCERCKHQFLNNKEIIAYLIYRLYMMYVWNSIQFFVWLYSVHSFTPIHVFCFLFVLRFTSLQSTNSICTFAVRMFLEFLQNQCNVPMTQEGIACQQYSCWCRDVYTCREAFKYVLFVSWNIQCLIMVSSELKTCMWGAPTLVN